MKKFLHIIILFLTYFLPIFCFEKLFIANQVNTEDLNSIYNESVFIFGILAALLSLVSMWLTPKYFHKIFFKGIIILIYTWFYYQACTSVAFEYRSLFGTTWRFSEIFPALVKSEWYFYVIGFIGVLLNFYAHSLLNNSTLKILDK